MVPEIIAMYLPQYHSIPENDEFWGKDFTDWVTVKNAKPLYDGHQQPRVPLKGIYYDLSQKENVKWQAQLAKEYGVYGFGIYHYWFNNEKNLLTKPAQIILDNKDIDINYCYAWDNISWKRSWSNVKENGNAWAPLIEKERSIEKGPSILIPYIIGTKEDWKKHYDYVLPFFKDSRYIKIDNKPVFIMFHKSEEILQMSDYWNELAIKDGFNGVKFVFRIDKNENVKGFEKKTSFRYEPISSGWFVDSLWKRILNKLKRILRGEKRLRIYDYDKIWKKIIRNAKKMTSDDFIPCGFVAYDDTPRRGKKGIVIKNSTPQKFSKYLFKLMNIAKKQNRRFVFLTAWNEWGEGAYLEPDTVNKYDYLTALNEVINRVEKL